MYSLKGIFPEPKKEQKKNFIKENMKQLKYIQGKTVKDPKSPHAVNKPGPNFGRPMSPHRNVATKDSMTKPKRSDLQVRKGDMAEFLRRKEMRHSNTRIQDEESDYDLRDSESSGNLRDIGCQTLEPTNPAPSSEAKLTLLYPKRDDDEGKLKASGDTTRQHNHTPMSPGHSGDTDYFEPEKRSRLNAILERKDNKDPYLPPGYQKGVVPKYLRERNVAGFQENRDATGDMTECPPGHVTLPDNERKETLKMLRNSFAELVSELNKMPVKTDTLRMRNRKMELEKQLAKLEEGIKVFSRPKVYVKIGE